MKVGLCWIAGVLIITIGLLFTSGFAHETDTPGELEHHLQLASELIQRDILVAQKELTLTLLETPSDSLNLLTQLGSLPLLGLASREADRFIPHVGYIPLLQSLPQQLDAVNWLCLPECQLVLKVESMGRELIAMVSLEEQISRYSKQFGMNFTISKLSAEVAKEGAEHAPTQAELSFTILDENNGNLAITHSPVSQGMAQKAGVISIWLLALLLQCLALFYYWKQKRRSKYFHQVLSDAADNILRGNSEKVHQMLGVASHVSDGSGRSLLRRLAMLGLREESVRASLSKVNDEQKWLENHDKLTELANRQYFRQQLDQLLQQSKSPMAFLLVNIDDFKEINDASGQQVGNDMLLKVARLLKRQLQGSDLLGRMSGDEFAVAATISDFSEGEVLAQRVIEASHHVMLAGRTMLHRLSLSIGIVMAPEHGKEFDTLMTRADVALSYSKKQGKGRFASLKDPELEGHLLKQRFMYSRVHSAIRDRRLALASQPIVDMNTGILSHSEILLRVQNELGQYVSAYPLIQAAERHRDVGVLDKWVLNQVLNYLMQCRREGRNVRLAVNISGVSISDPQITESILQRIEFSGCGKNLIIEITESAALENIERIQKDIERLQLLGCKVALDDFGIGYSSVNNLLNLPFDYVKVDGCFVRKLDKDSAIAPLMEFLVSISSLRGFQLIAEFVEAPEVAGQLQLLGVQLAQGYYYGEPVLLLKGSADNPTLLPASSPLIHQSGNV